MIQRNSEPVKQRDNPGPLDWLNTLWARPDYQSLNATERSVLLVIFGFINAKSMSWSMSHAAIAERAGLNRATVIRAVGKLSQTSLLEVCTEHRKPNTYRLSCAAQNDLGAQGDPLRRTKRPLAPHKTAQLVAQNDPNPPTTLHNHPLLPKCADSQTDLTVHSEPTAETTALAFAPTNGVSSSERAIVAKAIVSEGIDVGAVDQESVEALAMSAKLVGRLWPKGYSTSGRTGRTVDHMIRAVQTELMVRGGTVGENCGKIARAVQAQCEAAQKSIGRGWQGQCPFLPGINKWLDQGGYRAAPDRFVQSIRGDETEMQRIIRESKERSAV